MQNSPCFAIDTQQNFQWLLSVLRRLRPDVVSASGGDPVNFLSWMINSGIKEYALLREHAFFKSYLNSAGAIAGLSVLQSLVYKARPDVAELFPLPANQSWYLKWFYTYGVKEHGLEAIVGSVPQAAGTGSGSRHGRRESSSDKPFGVNLIGYAFGELGIGENLRAMARALELSGVPFTILDFPPGPDVSQNDRSMEQFVGTDAPYSINVFCMTALETARCYLTLGKKLFEGRYNIGSWHWEFERWPEEWVDLIPLVDEIWVASSHVRRGLETYTDVPSLVMPLAIYVGDVAELTREDFGLPKDSYLFCFSFDFRSYFQRKNPAGALEAFKLAFPASEGKVGLVIKAHKPAEENGDWERLKSAAREDGRIFIIEETLRKPELLALYKNCDCYLSLHRAEGYGMGIAEALLLGLEVITTGYSGNVDFCREESKAHLVDYALAPVLPGEYPYNKGQKWAEPDLRHAASLMRLCANRKSAGMESENFPFSLAVAGQRYRQRFMEIRSGIPAGLSATIAAGVARP